VFLRYKNALMAHMSDFMAELDRYLPRLAAAVGQVETTGLDKLLDLIAAADQRPLMTSDEVRQDWQRRWLGVRTWFVAGPAGPAGPAAPATYGSRAAELGHATRAGVSTVIALLRQITEAQRGGVNRATQLRHLAGWVTNVADDDAGHALMSAAFNLRLARHLGGVHDDTDLISPRLSWQNAPGVEIAVPLFRRGKVPGSGVPQRIHAQPGLRAELRRRQAGHRAAERQAGRQLLRADLAEAVLDEAQTAVLLKLLTRALEARSVVAGQITGGTGANDVLTLRLLPAAQGSRVRTPNGILHLPGLRLEITAARPTARLAATRGA
jgi:uncharacterized protein (TIGR02677 family)